MLVHQAVADPPRDHPWAVCCASSSLASSPAATGCHRRAAGQSLVGVQALQLIIASMGPAFAPELDPELRMLLLKALLHPNRFVRETAYHCLAEVCALLPREQLLAQAPSFCERLCDGLVENWSQVRTWAAPACELGHVERPPCRALLLWAVCAAARVPAALHATGRD